MTKRAIVPARGVGDPGPAMRKLRPRQRAFVYALMQLGANVRKNDEAALMAGYTGNPQTLRVTASRLMRDPNILAALREAGETRMHSATALATSVLTEIAGDVLHKDRLKAAFGILDRVGLHTKSEHTMTITDNRTDKELLTLAAQLCAQLGIDPVKLLGKPTVDAEFEEVKAPTGREGLEDLL